MLPDSNTLAAVQAMTVQVACTNALRGLLALEHEADPRCGALVATINLDGSVDVEILSADLDRIEGYSL